MLEIGVPLWIVEHTQAPRWTVALVLIINTAGVVLFQVRASRGTETTRVAARAMWRSGFLIGVACLLYALSAGWSAWLAVAVLVVAGMVHVTGELLQAAGGFGLSYSLAADGRHGQYQGAFGMGFQVSQLAAPLLVTALPLTLGTTGWAVLAAMFVLVGLAVLPAARWAERTRPVSAVA